MPIHHAVLTLLSDSPSYGYELKSQFEEAIGPQWGGLNIGHLYQILDRLEREGTVTRSELAQSSRPNRTLYTLTSQGRDELNRWISEPCVRSGYRDELFLKLFAASRLGTDALARFVTVQRAACFSEIGSLTRLRAQHFEEPLIALLIDAAIAHTTADLQVIESASIRLGDLASAAALHQAEAAGSRNSEDAQSDWRPEPPDAAMDAS